MPWRYEQSTGRLYRPDGVLFHTGYAGFDWARNQPVLQHIENMGPIPQGRWRMTARIMTTYQGKLPPVIRLEPEPGTSLLGRAGGFLIHGDNTESNASQGCIIVGGAANRNIIWNDGDRIIEVVP